MSYDQVSDVLEEARRFYQKTADFYEQLSNKTEKMRVAMLLQYMARREKGFADIVNTYRQEANPAILKQWLQFSPPKTVANTLDQLEQKPIESVDELTRIASQMDSALIEYYRKLANLSRKPEVQAAFAHLIDATLQKDREMLFNAHFLKEY